MKKLLFTAALIGIYAAPSVFAHTAKKEVKKDDTMLNLEKKVRELILEKGDYDSALKIYASAARKYTCEPYYKEQYSILRRVIKMKKAMKSEKTAELTDSQKKKWTSYYFAIRGYYYAQGYYSESLALDKNASEILKTDQAKINYLETMVVLDHKDQAQKFCSEITGPLREKTIFRILGLLARPENTDNFNVIQELGKIAFSPEDNPRCMVYSACIYQLNNNHEKACQSIIKALESTPPTVIPATRKLIRNMKQLQKCSESRKFQAALKTESKVYQSGCTGGSSCNTCSLKGKCPSTK